MADEAKKGFLSRLFGTKNSGCCNVKIEEVTEEKPEEPENKKQNGFEEEGKRKS